MSPNAKKDWNSWWKGREKDYENEIVLPVPSSDVYPAGIGGKENSMKRCVNCEEYYKLRSKVCHKTVYCDKGSKSVYTTSNKSIACSNFKQAKPFSKILED